MISSHLHVDAPEELVRTYLPAELTLSATDDAVSNVLSCLLVACGLGSVVSRVGIQPLLRPLDSAGVVEDVERSRMLWPVCRHGELTGMNSRPSVRGLVITEVDHRRLAGNLLVHHAVGVDELISRESSADYSAKW